MEIKTYSNDFLYIVLRSADEKRGLNAIRCCIGVNITRFLPITKGRHRLGLNPAVKGLQNIALEIKSLALSNGAVPKSIRSGGLTGIALSKKDSWCTEEFLIENATSLLPDKIIDHAVLSLLKNIFTACMLEEQMPDKLLPAEELEEFIERLCVKYRKD